MGNTDIYYLVHSTGVGDTVSSTPTLRNLFRAHDCKINVVTHNHSIFENNPYVNQIFSFDYFEKIRSSLSSKVLIYESFTYAGTADGNGIEKKFGHIDIRQVHAMDLGFQLPPEELYCEMFPSSVKNEFGLPEKYVVLHVTNTWLNRSWSYENWRKLIQWLSDNRIFTVLIGAGQKENVHNSISATPLEKQCPTFNNLYGIDLCNRTTLSDVWHVINGAKCVITMDSGPLHIAGTTDTYIIQLGSAVHPSFRAPYRNGSQNYKYSYIAGECNIFCNSSLRYNVNEWGSINAVPPQIGCLEGYSSFKCHPNYDEVVETLIKIIT